MRFYRNSSIERWVDALLANEQTVACNIATELAANDSIVWITRDLEAARAWARGASLGGERIGLIASGQGRRLAAHGLFVELKPDIATWMLAPSTDIRSSNALETVQNTYQVQGLELDYSVVCWDADLRRDNGKWRAHKLNGDDWSNDSLTDVALNGYRVLLTRSRKGMAVFVPPGDETGLDTTRRVDFYDGIANFLLASGARPLPMD